jgi:hypothetical protein
MLLPPLLRQSAEVTMQREGTMSTDPELLHGLSEGELEALSEGLLAPPAQARLDALLASNIDQSLSAAEQLELERLLERVDQLTVLKTRARYTLHQQRAGAVRT